MLTVSEYQTQAHDFATYPNVENGDLNYPILGLAEEAGEVVGKYAKQLRDFDGVISQTFVDAIKKELGDVCWMVSEICTQLELSLEDVLQTNLDKLTSRKERGVLHGSGDDR